VALQPFPDRDIVPENRIGGGSDLLSLPGRAGSQKGFQLVRKQPGRARTLRPLPEFKCWRILRMTWGWSMKEIIPRATLGAGQGIDFIDLAQ